MVVEFRPVELASRHHVEEARLVFRKGRLIAVISRLDESQGELAGRWFVEACFDGIIDCPRDTFDDLADIEQWVDSLR